MAYVVIVAAFAVLVGAFVVRGYGFPDVPALGVFLLLALLHIVLPDAVVETQTRVSLASVVQLAGLPIVGPAGASVVGAVLGVSLGRGLPWNKRLFNAAQFSLAASLGGLVYLWAGGTLLPELLAGPTELVEGLALPLFVADVAQAVVNLVALAAVVRISTGIPMRHQMLLVLRGTGLAYVGYGVIALTMVVLWRPADLGPTAAVIVLAPLVVAQWAYRQHAEELRGQQRALEVLVAAVEAKAPRLAGHSARVAELSGRMAEQLGLSPQQVADTRVAGMLHDVGQTSLPTPLVRALDLTDPAASRDYPARSAAILGDLDFLRGAIDPILRHQEGMSVGSGTSLPARIVGLADAYDLLTQVGDALGRVHAPTRAEALLAERAGNDPAIARALHVALTRPSEPGPRR
ncbi:HD domain-containing protein [Phycicoccus sp. MAQZ13P-2]|uniref:HD-GYP domain-containing protein n=1 Tax=Phycicoccus mangrovi TaxID=2840470 RepID=UPI001C002565|nr:HD domain-containing phosphohydrolase [Phycicoccus mangrovi]MBT9254135.1 HD domain-containing protein [Phycicoccus mangrovi]MBT9272514.1 HD domain-containing protein [Phycicoccus mangrovi]